MSDGGKVVDFVFRLRGEAIAVDYADRLWCGLVDRLAWLADEVCAGDAGVHPLAGVSAGRGELYLTHRARLTLRLPAARAGDVGALSGHRLELGGAVDVGPAGERPLAPFSVLYSSFVAFPEADEAQFLECCGAGLAALGVRTPQLVCGKTKRAVGPDGERRGFSLMIAGLSVDESLAVQRVGLGGERGLGCGLFVPHKSIAAVGEAKLG